MKEVITHRSSSVSFRCEADQSPCTRRAQWHRAAPGNGLGVSTPPRNRRLFLGGISHLRECGRVYCVGQSSRQGSDPLLRKRLNYMRWCDSAVGRSVGKNNLLILRNKMRLAPRRGIIDCNDFNELDESGTLKRLVRSRGVVQRVSHLSKPKKHSTFRYVGGEHRSWLVRFRGDAGVAYPADGRSVP